MNPELQKLQAKVIADLNEVLSRDQSADGSGLPGVTNVERCIMMMISAIERTTGPHSSYAQRARMVIEECRQQGQMPHIASYQLDGIVHAIREDYAAGHFIPYAELVKADVFGDLLDMAAHQLESGYVDAAAIMMGGVLEGHLRTLAKKNKVAIERQTNRGKMEPLKATMLNVELKKACVYGVTDEKHVEAWQSVRNDAGHPEQGTRQVSDPAKVASAISGVRDFIDRYPA